MSQGLNDASLVLIPENKREDDAEQQRIAGKNKPDALPVLGAVDREMVDHPPAAHPTQESSEAIGHDHEQPLRAGADSNGRLFFNEKGAGNIEKIEGHSVDDHRQHQQEKAAAGIADGKEPEAEHPGENAHQHHFLNAKALEEKRDRQDKKCFGDL